MISIQAQTQSASIRISGIGNDLRDLRLVFVNFHAYMMRRTQLMFSRLKRGGEFRGERWQWFADQYTRKDGSTVPAQGDSRTQGRMRHSGKRVTSSSSIMRDTGRMATAALTGQTLLTDAYIMRTPLDYADFQHQLRPFMFFEDPQDPNYLEKLLMKRLERSA